MQGHVLVGASEGRSGPRRLTPWLVLAVIALAGPSLAQSFLGSIRGTVTDPQGAAVPKAAVLVVDEATGVPRPVETDGEGRFDASNPRPGTHRVEVVTASFTKFERAGRDLRAAGTPLGDLKPARA